MNRFHALALGEEVVRLGGDSLAVIVFRFWGILLALDDNALQRGKKKAKKII